MQTKYNVGDRLLISAKVTEIKVTDDGKIEYLLKYKDNGSHATYYTRQYEEDIKGVDDSPEEEDTPIVPNDSTPDEPVTPGDDINPDDTGTTDDTGSGSTTTTDGEANHD